MKKITGALGNQIAQVIRYSHGLKRIDASSACVSDGYPDSGKQDRCDHARHLADDFATIALAQAGAQHQPMHMGVAQGSPLSENVRAFKMSKAGAVVAEPQGGVRQGYFPEVGMVHD